MFSEGVERLTKTSMLFLMSGFFLGTWFTNGASLAQTSKVLSVCDVLADPKKYAGQMVTIRGALVSSAGDTNFDELAPLESERCYRPRRQDSLRVSLVAYGAPPDDWKPDVASLERAQKILDGLLEREPNLRRLIVTIEGIA